MLGALRKRVKPLSRGCLPNLPLLWARIKSQGMGHTTCRCPKLYLLVSWSLFPKGRAGLLKHENHLSSDPAPRLYSSLSRSRQ